MPAATHTSLRHSETDCVDRALSILGLTPVTKTIVAKGLHYSMLPRNPEIRGCVVSVDSTKPEDLPRVDVSHIFSNPNNVPLLSAMVTVDRHRFLVMGYLDFQLPQNPNLQDIFPHLPWNGEIVVFSLGRRVRVLSRPVGARYLIQKAITVYIRAVIEARMSQRALAKHITFLSQSVFLL